MNRNRTTQRGLDFTLFAAIVVLVTARQAHAEIGTAPFRINSSVAGNQSLSDVSMSGSGEWIAIFREESDNSNFARRYDAAGRPRATANFSVLGQLAALDWFGKFMATRFAPDGSSNGIFSTLYDPLGVTLRAEQRVHASIAGNQAGPSVASNANGDSVVSWTSDGKVWARRFGPDGTSIGSELEVAPGSPVGVRMDYWGNFVVVYLKLDATQPLWNVWARPYTASGVASAEVRLTDSPRPIFNGAKLGMNETGVCVVVWDEKSGRSYGQRFTLGGTLLGGLFPLYAQESLGGRAPDVGVALDGSFVVVYLDAPLGVQRVVKRAFAANGVPLGDPQVVAQSDATATIWPSWPRIAMDRDGGYAVAWTRSDTSGQRDAYARRFLPEGISISTLQSGSLVSALAGVTGSWRYYRLSVPAGATTLNASIGSAAGTGDADLYLRFGAVPSLSSWDASPYLNGSNETITWPTPAAGDWFLGINAFASYTGVTLAVSYQY